MENIRKMALEAYSQEDLYFSRRGRMAGLFCFVGNKRFNGMLKQEEGGEAMRRWVSVFLMMTMLAALTACGQGDGAGLADDGMITEGNAENVAAEDAAAGSEAGAGVSGEDTLVYGSGDYTRINPAMDEHGEINLLLFDGLTAHDGENQVVPGLAESWEYDAKNCMYTFHLRDGVTWHDGEPFTAEDVKFTIETIMDPDNGSENAPNYEDVTAITVEDPLTVRFTLNAPNAAFLDYMTMPVLPEHLLAGEDMQTSEFFRHPVGTGPYKLESWEEGQAITLVKNDDYYKGAPNIGHIVFRIVTDDNAKALQMQSGELDLALLTPKDAQNFKNHEGYVCYDMKTSDYRGVLFNFAHPYWQENRDLIPAVCYGIDREAIVNAVLLGEGMPAYGPLQRNRYNNEDVEHYDYDPAKAEQVLQCAGCEKQEDGYYYRNGEKVGFVLSVGAGDQVRLDMARIVAQEMQEIGMDVTVDIPAQVDWSGQMAYLIGWGSPFDADDHTYKVFGTGKGANYSGYSNEQVDRYLLEARQTEDPEKRAAAYNAFQEALAADPAFAFICYVDVNYVADERIQGIDADTVMGHHGVGIFWNVEEWTF